MEEHPSMSIKNLEKLNQRQFEVLQAVCQCVSYTGQQKVPLVPVPIRVCRKTRGEGREDSEQVAYGQEIAVYQRMQKLVTVAILSEEGER
jgi:hypothetical protein